MGKAAVLRMGAMGVMGVSTNHCPAGHWELLIGVVLCCHVLVNIRNTYASSIVLLLPPRFITGSFKYLLQWTPTYSVPWFYHEYFTILAYYISAHLFPHHRFNFNLDVLTLYSVNSLANWLWIFFFTIGVFRNLNIHNQKKFYIRLYIIIYFNVTSFGVYM